MNTSRSRHQAGENALGMADDWAVERAILQSGSSHGWHSGYSPSSLTAHMVSCGGHGRGRSAYAEGGVRRSHEAWYSGTNLDLHQQIPRLLVGVYDHGLDCMEWTCARSSLLSHEPPYDQNDSSGAYIHSIEHKCILW